MKGDVAINSGGKIEGGVKLLFKCWSGLVKIGGWNLNAGVRPVKAITRVTRLSHYQSG